MEKIIFYRYGNSGDHRNDYIFQDKEYLDNILNNVSNLVRNFHYLSLVVIILT